MFFECKVRTVGTGSNHVIVLASATPDDHNEPHFDFNLPLQEAEEDSEYFTAHDGEEQKEEVKQPTVMREQHATIAEAEVVPVILD